MGTGYCAPFHHGKRRLAGWVPAESAGGGIRSLKEEVDDERKTKRKKSPLFLYGDAAVAAALCFYGLGILGTPDTGFPQGLVSEQYPK